MIAVLRRRTELGLILLAAVIVGGAYTLASLGRTSSIPANIGPFLGIILALFVAAHIATRKLAPGADGLVLPIAALLNGIGYVMIARLDEASRNPQGLAAAQAGWTVIGIGAFIATLIVVRRARDLQRYRYTFLLVGLLLLMAPLAPVIGREVNGARIWAYIGPINFQPGEFAKVVLAIFFASYLVEKRELLGMATWPRFRPVLPDLKHLGPVLVAWVVSIVIMTLEKDLGSSLLFFALFMLLVWVATGRAAYVVVGALLFAAAALFTYKTFGHVQERVDIWLDPWKDYTGSGFQVAQSWFAMAWGGVAGTGLGLGNPNQIPVVTTDFVFAAIGEELGLLGASAVIFCFILLVGCGLRIAVRAEPPFEKLLAAGLTILLGVQSFIIMAGVTRLLPLTGVTLPFVSYGGSSLVANYVLLALLVRISDDTARRIGEVSADGKAAADPIDATRVS
ncbi:MAG TPA: FtsW/RodA/SpoVE family cell cycle protein [Acidimicrobiales bacterium]|jgi:peptidoglycan glycosyltransferase|nr:FtsW/RodA/SpoVE family cell cycle protein [Acidimicrobiales bacterium]